MCKQVFKDKAKDIVEEMIIEARQKGYTHEDIAEAVGGSPKSIQHYLYGEAIPSFPVVLGIHRTVKSEKLASTIAKEAGGIFIRLPEISSDNHLSVLSKKIAMSLHEFSEFVDKIGDATADNRITELEARQIEKEGYEAIEKILELIETARRLAK